jgi:hypothetical protein
MTKAIKLKGRDKRELEYVFEGILYTLSTMVRGRRYSDEEIKRLGFNRGLVEFRDGNVFDLLPETNNHWLFLESKKNWEYVFRIKNRYSTQGYDQLMMDMIVALNHNAEIIDLDLQTS